MLIGLPPTGKAEIIQQQTAVAVVLRKTPITSRNWACMP